MSKKNESIGKITYEKVFRTSEPLEFHQADKWDKTFSHADYEEAVYAKNSKGEVIGQIAKISQWLCNLAVKKEYRNHGIATELIHAITKDVFGNSAWLEADASALPFYEKFTSEEYTRAVDAYRKEHPKEQVTEENELLKVDLNYLWRDYGEYDNGDHLYGIGLKNSYFGEISAEELKTLARNVLDKVGTVHRWFNLYGDDNKRIRIEEIKLEDPEKRLSGYKVLHTYKIKSITYDLGDEVTIQFETKQRDD